jgi:hypothetical protein
MNGNKTDLCVCPSSWLMFKRERFHAHSVDNFQELDINMHSNTDTDNVMDIFNGHYIWNESFESDKFLNKKR